MNRRLILASALERAGVGGWGDGARALFTVDVYGEPVEYEKIIFNHGFARALWGDKEHKPARFVKRREYFTMPATGSEVHEVNLDRMEYDVEPGGWQYHLQQMVIAEDPIAYLGNNLL